MDARAYPPDGFRARRFRVATFPSLYKLQTHRLYMLTYKVSHYSGRLTTDVQERDDTAPSSYARAYAEPCSKVLKKGLYGLWNMQVSGYKYPFCLQLVPEPS
jgi:hypothetical protein